MAAGQIVYHGPREEVLPFFESCGFRHAVRKATPDFLQEVTSQKDQEVCGCSASVFVCVALVLDYALPGTCLCLCPAPPRPALPCPALPCPTFFAELESQGQVAFVNCILFCIKSCSAPPHIPVLPCPSLPSHDPLSIFTNLPCPS